jgi:hypothetical protein
MIRAVAIVLAAALVVPATAAAFGPKTVSAAPASAQAGANSNFTVDFDVDEPSRDIKGFVIHLPAGEVGAATATPLCSQAQFAAKACPANTQVGTTTTTATLLSLPLPVPLAIPGVLYNLAPVGSEPARLGIRLTPTVGDEVLLQAIITVRPSDGGLDSSVDGLPNSASGIPIDVTAIDITLFGRAGNPAKGFMSNPTSCGTATTTIDAFAYDGARGSATASFTPTACDKLPFAPKLSAVLDGAAKGAHPALTTVVQQSAGEANARSVEVTLPLGIGAVPAVLLRACPEAVLAQGACPASARIGSAKAETPALAAPLSGPVVLVKPAAMPLPQLLLDLHGPISLRLPVTFGFGPGGRLRSTLTGLPDTALSRFTLNLDGGKDGLLANGRDICAGAPRVDAAFVAQSGATSSASVTPEVRGCSPTGKATLKGLARKRPTLVLRVSTGLGPKLTSLGLTLPRALRLERGHVRKALTVLATGRKVAKPSLRRTARTLTVRGLPKGGTSAVELRLRRGALALARKLKAGTTVTLKLSTKDVTGAQQKLTLRVRAAR